MKKPAGTRWILGLLLVIVIAAVLALTPTFASPFRGVIFLVVVLLLAAGLALVGWAKCNRALGAFIDDRNRVSLSKLQMGAWTVVVLAAFATTAVFNMHAVAGGGTLSALKLQIPGELLLAMGISATSFVATPGILSLKMNQTPSNTPLTPLQASYKGGQFTRKGNVINFDSVGQASIGDIFSGDEISNAAFIDMSKVQQVFVTAILLVCYVLYIFNVLSSSESFIGTLPTIDKSFVWLMGISHASYLAYKAAPHGGA